MTDTMQLILAASLLLSMPVVAQVPTTPEDLATVKQNEVARIDRDSIKQYDSTVRFEIFINWDQSQGVRPPDHLARKVRYVADCKAGTVTLAAIGAFHISGRAVQTMVIPPGASDPVTPAEGSDQARWLADVCKN